jgi:hypothetical protein
MQKYDARVSPNGVKTFRTAGDAGDALLSMPAVKAMGGGIVFLEAANYTRERLTPDNWRGLDRILKAQSYIEDCREWTGGAVDVNLNDFRGLMFPQVRRGLHRDRHITDWVAMAHNLPLTIKDEPWLTIEPVKVAPVVINRTGPGRHPGHVYHGQNFPWGRVVQKYRTQAVFIGTALEHEIFAGVFGDVPYYSTPSLFEAAQVIAGASLFIGSQSCPHALAQGLGRPIILEVWHNGPNCLGTRPNIVNAWDHKVELPDL